MVEREGVSAVLERWSPTLYLVGAVLLVGFAMNTALATYTGTSYTDIAGIIGTAGFVLGILGLLGLYPALAERSPRVARVAALIAVVCALNWAVASLKLTGQAAGVIPEIGSLRAIQSTLAFLTMVFSYGLFGATGLRAGVYDRTVGGLMLLESVNFLLLIGTVASPIAIPLITFEIVHVIVHGGIGVRLWRNGVPSDRMEPVPDSTV